MNTTSDSLPWDNLPDTAPAKGRKATSAAPLELAGADAPNLDLLPRADAPAIWNEFREQVMALKDTAETLTVTDINDAAGMAKARETRLSIRQIRLTVEKKRVELGEHHLRAKQQVDREAKAIKDACDQYEGRLALMEEFGDRERARLADELRKAREEALQPYMLPGSGPAGDLAALDEAAWGAMLTDAKDLHDLRAERERKAREEQERLAAEERAAEQARREEEAKQREAERVERERLRAENERLAAEAEADRVARRVAEDAARQENLRLQREREAERKKQQAEIDRANAEAEAARKEKIRLETEERMRRVEEAAAETRRREAEAEAARKAASAPDRERLEAFAAVVAELSVPVLSAANKAQSDRVAGKMGDMAVWIRKIAAEL